jgi:F-type H+-transporting ATPase subunit delta
MPQPRLAGRYAKSLIDLSKEQNQLDLIHADMVRLQMLCKESKPLLNLLRSPVIKADKKLTILEQAIFAGFNQLTAAFMRLLVQKGRESVLPEIAVAFIEQYNQINDIHHVKLTTATPVSDEIKSLFAQKVKEAISVKKVELEAQVNESLIGGFQLEFDGNLVDASIARDLRDIRKQFEQNIYVSDIR